MTSTLEPMTFSRSVQWASSSPATISIQHSYVLFHKSPTVFGWCTEKWRGELNEMEMKVFVEDEEMEREYKAPPVISEKN